MKRDHSVLLAICATLLSPALARSEQATFKVKHELRAKPDSTSLWWLVESGATLVIDDTARRITVTTKPNPLDIGADAVVKVIFERTTHARGGGWGNLLSVVGLGSVGSAIEGKAISDYWCYIEYRDGDGIKPYVLELPKEVAATVIDKLIALVGVKVITPRFADPVALAKADAPRDNAGYDYKADSKVHPLPEMKPGKALLLVVCPFIDNPVNRGPLVKLYANGRVIAVNNWGSYAFVHLDPGEYTLVSQIKDVASSQKVTLEAGQEYYFLEDIMNDDQVILTRHSKELVMHQTTGARFAGWTQK